MVWLSCSAGYCTVLKAKCKLMYNCTMYIHARAISIVAHFNSTAVSTIWANVFFPLTFYLMQRFRCCVSVFDRGLIISWIHSNSFTVYFLLVDVTLNIHRKIGRNLLFHGISHAGIMYIVRKIEPNIGFQHKLEWSFHRQ